MSGEKKQKPEELLAKIRKIEENKYCVNCGEYAKLGHTNVCGNPLRLLVSLRSSLQLLCVPYV